AGQEAYVVVRSGNDGRTGKLLLSEAHFGVRAPFTIDSYSDPWTTRTQRTSSAGARPAANMDRLAHDYARRRETLPPLQDSAAHEPPRHRRPRRRRRRHHHGEEQSATRAAQPPGHDQ